MADTEKEPIIEGDHVTRMYTEEEGVRDLTLQIQSGDFYGLLGPNGAGKSTSMYLLLGLVSRDSGQARLHGFDVHRSPEKARRRTGTLLESPRFYNTMDPIRNILIMNNHSPEVNRAEAEKRLQDVGLTDAIGRPVGQFSSGMQQRLGIATALAGPPDLVFLDEPTSNLDPDGVESMLTLFERLNRDESVTFFYCTHRISEVKRLSNRIGVLKNGSIKQEIDQNETYPLQYMNISVSPAADARERIEQTFGLETTRTENGLLRVQLNEIDPGDINRDLVENGFHVKSLEPVRKGLLDLYREA